MSRPVRPAEVCRELAAAMEASEGRRKRRQRDTTPDAIGMAIKRDLLDAVIRNDPGPEDFEGWLLGYCLGRAESASVGAVRAMALDVLREWQLVQASPEFSRWLAAGAPSDDRL